MTCARTETSRAGTASSRAIRPGSLADAADRLDVPEGAALSSYDRAKPRFWRGDGPTDRSGFHPDGRRRAAHAEGAASAVATWRLNIQQD
ncbi:hypothetical protein Sa4125_40500 [Aureimonas sp. SA4125]|nr:hypothetical protein Sa4125_40500 [Aureimonas sp. SA4125]